MARAYSASGGAQVGTNVTILTLVSATSIRPRITYLNIGCAATPADHATKFEIQRFTAAGTAGSAFTPTSLDPSNPAATATVGVGTFTTEPTYTANSKLLTISMNQRATHYWYASPGYELIAPSTAANGLGLRSVTATGTAIHDATFLFEE